MIVSGLIKRIWMTKGSINVYKISESYEMLEILNNDCEKYYATNGFDPILEEKLLDLNDLIIEKENYLNLNVKNYLEREYNFRDPFIKGEDNE